MCGHGCGRSGCVSYLGAAAALSTSLFAFAMRSEDKSIVGTWEGAIKVGAIELRLVFHVKKDDKVR